MTTWGPGECQALVHMVRRLREAERRGDDGMIPYLRKRVDLLLEREEASRRHDNNEDPGQVHMFGEE